MRFPLSLLLCAHFIPDCCLLSAGRPSLSPSSLKLTPLCPHHFFLCPSLTLHLLPKSICHFTVFSVSSHSQLFLFLSFSRFVCNIYFYKGFLISFLCYFFISTNDISRFYSKSCCRSEVKHKVTIASFGKKLW